MIIISISHTSNGYSIIIYCSSRQNFVRSVSAARGFRAVNIIVAIKGFEIKHHKVRLLLLPVCAYSFVHLRCRFTFERSHNELGTKEVSLCLVKFRGRSFLSDASERFVFSNDFNGVVRIFRLQIVWNCIFIWLCVWNGFFFYRSVSKPIIYLISFIVHYLLFIS